MKEVTIGDKKLGYAPDGTKHPAYIIAEMSVNHNQNFETAKKIIKAAADAGADALKVQTFDPDEITLDCRKWQFIAGGDENPESWDGKSLHELYVKAVMPWEWHEPLQKYAHDLGLHFFSTPQDQAGIDLLEKLDVPCYKVASYEVTHIPLLEALGKTGKPIIMSVGYASEEEIDEAVKTLKDNGTKELILLHCITAYSDNPVPEESNLATIKKLAEKYDCVSGFSDNNAGVVIPLASVMMGAAAVEKHVVADANDETFDQDFSVDPGELKEMVERIRNFEKMVGKPHFGPQSEKEKYNMRYRRSVYAVEDIKAGEALTKENCRVIRPAFGLAPREYKKVLTMKAKNDIERGTAISWDIIE